MGSPAEEPGRETDEGPQRAVRVSSFWMSVHEVTDDTFLIFRQRRLDSPAAAVPELGFNVDAVSRPSPPYEDPAQGMGGDNRPAVGMTRRAAMLYARWLSEKTGRLFRLPTEAEWEYACRGGETVAVDPSLLAELAWYEPNAGGRFHQVGRKAPNAWGLHDLRGNAAEWVLDGYSADAYAALPEVSAATDPVAGDPVRGRGVVRGGSYRDEADQLRCAARQPEMGAWKRRDPQIPKSAWWNTDAPHVGFRLVSPAREITPDEIRAYWDQILGD